MTSMHVRRLESRVARTAARFVEQARRDRLAVADLPGLKLPWYAVRDEADPGENGLAEVLIFDEIGGSFGISAKAFAKELQAITARNINVRINSPGGSVFDAIAIHSALVHHPARIVVYVDGVAASAASVVAMAGDEVVMMPGSQMMIHDASMVEDGQAADMEKAATFLHRQSDNVADMYRMRGGGEVAEWRELMLAETWMFAQEAVDAGLADRVQERPHPDGEQDERMSRSFDLSQYPYRYAGRRAAPEPARRRPGAVTREAPVTTPRPSTRRDTSTPADQREAAQRRGEDVRAAGQLRMAAAARGELDGPPVDAARRVSTAWMRAGAGRVPPHMRPDLPVRLRVEKRERGGKQFYVVGGYATVYERPYEMWDQFGPYNEVVSEGAGAVSLAADPDVIFLVNHRGLAMARTVGGDPPTLILTEDSVGLANEAWLNPGRSDVRDLVLNIDDKITTEQSFAFMIDAGRWNPDFTEYRIDAYDVNRGDTSAVNYGANPYTSIAARSREILDELDDLPVGVARAALDRLTIRADLYRPAVARSATPVPSRPTEPSTRTGMSLDEVAAWLSTVD